MILKYVYSFPVYTTEFNKEKANMCKITLTNL